MSPPVGFSAPTRIFASVDLPDPDSPTSASTSPRRSSRSTPSRAFSDVFCAPPNRPNRPWPSEYSLLMLATRSTAGCPVTSGCAVTLRHAVTPSKMRAVSKQAASRPGSTAASLGRSVAQRSTAKAQRGWNGQPVRAVGEVGREAGDRDQLPVGLVEVGGRVEQALGVRVARIGEHVLHPAPLDDLARVHDGQFPARLVDDAEVVGHEDERRVGVLAQLLEQPEHLVLHRHVESGGRLVAQQQLRRAGQAPSRS